MRWVLVSVIVILSLVYPADAGRDRAVQLSECWL
jgi:hypothetical protein